MAMVGAARRWTAQVAGTHKELQCQGKKKRRRRKLIGTEERRILVVGCTDSSPINPKPTDPPEHRNQVFKLCTMTNKCTQLFHKLSHRYMFRHYRVILRQLVINTLPSYTSISNAAVGNTVYN